jgi:eukaryotic-like serine/threonine-protein kinase
MNGIYRFGPFQADLPNRQLSQEGRLIPLTPKVFQTLEVLLRNRDRVIPKHELLSAIWPESHVEESNLTQNISVLRKALGERNALPIKLRFGNLRDSRKSIQR